MRESLFILDEKGVFYDLCISLEIGCSARPTTDRQFFSMVFIITLACKFHHLICFEFLFAKVVCYHRRNCTSNDILRFSAIRVRNMSSWISRNPYHLLARCRLSDSWLAASWTPKTLWVTNDCQPIEKKKTKKNSPSKMPNPPKPLSLIPKPETQSWSTSSFWFVSSLSLLCWMLLVVWLLIRFSCGFCHFRGSSHCVCMLSIGFAISKDYLQSKLFAVSNLNGRYTKTTKSLCVCVFIVLLR